MNLDQALKYRSQGLSVIPCRKDKKPLIKWEEYQKRIAEKEEIADWFKLNPEANIGIVTGVISGVEVIDIDSKEGEDNLQKYFPDKDFFNTPTALTPRGGKHLYYNCDDEKLINNVGAIPGCDFRANGGYVIAPPSINGEGKEYKWLISPEQMGWKKCSNEYLHFIKSASSYNNSLISSNSLRDVTQNVTLFQKGRRDNDLFHAGNLLMRGGAKHTEIREMMYFIGRSCNPPFPDAEIEIKYQSVVKRCEKKELNMTQLVEEFIFSTDGAFTLTECYKSVTDRYNALQPQSTFRVIFKRLKDKGIINKFGDKDGWYVRVNNVVEKIDFINASTDHFDISYPFDIECLFQTFSKNIIVLAGSPNAGKTAFLLNLVRKNMDKHEIHYFSSEMGSMELRDRLSKFNDTKLEDWKFNPWERSSDFSSVIRPDAINIIDFLEINDKFYEVGQILQNIYQKLTTGIAVIAIQKKNGADMGRGAEFSLEKPRLYLSMDAGKIKIVKAKNWACSEINPNKMCLDYKIHKGCNFEILHHGSKLGWYNEEEKK